MTDGQNILDFKYGLVKDGGSFNAGTDIGGHYALLTVSHSEIHLASKVVRAILQERRLLTSAGPSDEVVQV